MNPDKNVLGRAEKAGFEFFISDLDVAITLTRIASASQKDSGKRARNQANARQAYNSISRISSHALLSAQEKQEVEHKLKQLRTALEQLGEVFS